MTSVANQSVGSDSISGSVAGGTKSIVGNRETFLAPARGPNATVGGVQSGTLGGSLGAGTGTPKSSAGTLTSIEKPLKAGS